jgi:hypothetical protein
MGKIIFNIAKASTDVYPSRKRLLHKCKIHRAMKFELAIRQHPWKLTGSMSCIIASSTAEELSR